MPRGRFYFGPGFWKGGPGPAPWAGGCWWAGNPYPFCRFFPWLPRRWWAYPGYAAGWGAYPGPGWAPGPGAAYPQDEAEFLKQQAGFLQQQLDQINARLKDLEKKE
ncbi:MAG: DUF5320 domain-containing protein [Firmicutes bacterium]|nr:DUF5320 domain-containing protein [Bacillota bacterium]